MTVSGSVGGTDPRLPLNSGNKLVFCRGVVDER